MNNYSKVATFKTRLIQALNIRDMRQIDLAEKTKISKASISQYISGRATDPTTERIYLISKALNVDPVWLMGFDVPMEEKKVVLTEMEDLAEQIKNNPKIFEVVNYFTRLSQTNQELVLNLCRSLIPTEDQQ